MKILLPLESVLEKWFVESGEKARAHVVGAILER